MFEDKRNEQLDYKKNLTVSLNQLKTSFEMKTSTSILITIYTRRVFFQKLCTFRLPKASPGVPS